MSAGKLHLVAINWRDLRNPEAGGAEVHLHEILTRMAERGHRVTLFVSRFPGCADEETYDGIRVIRRGQWYNANFVIPRAVRSYLASDPADLIIEDINKIPFFMPRFTDVPVLAVIPHLFGITIFRETNPILAAYVYFWERFIPSVYRRRRFAVISPSTKQDLISRGIPETDVDVVLCGLDHGTFRLNPDVGKYDVPTIVHFGRVRKYKAIDVVIKAFARIRGRVENARLVIIGDGPELDNLKQLSSRLGLDESVEFTGRISTADLVDILNRCHLFMNASPKEGWGLTVVEANACGVPVIGSDRPGLQDSIHHEQTGYLVPYGDVEAFASRGIELLTDSERWSQMRSAGLQWANSLTWERCADEMEQLFLREVR